MSAEPCPLCQDDALVPLFDVKDAAGAPATLRLCQRCFVLAPEYADQAIARERMTQEQAHFHETLWSSLPREEADQLRDELLGLVEFYRNELGPPSDEIVFDIGAGRGALVAALRKAGYPARGCEPSSQLTARAREAYGFAEDEYLDLPADAFLARVREQRLPVGHFFLWHVIEHVTDPVGLLRNIAECLPVGHYVFLQAPCVKSDYLYPEHLILMTEPAIHALARNAGCEVASTGYDHDMAYVSFVLRRLDVPVPTTWQSADERPREESVARGIELFRTQQRLLHAERDLASARALAEERYAAIERQKDMIDARNQWHASLAAELAAARSEATQSRARVAELARELEELKSGSSARIAAQEATIAEQRDMLRRHEDRIVAQEDLLRRSGVRAFESVVKRLRNGVKRA